MVKSERTLEQPSRHRVTRIPVLLAMGMATASVAALALPDSAASRAAVAVILAATLLAVAWQDRAAGILATAGYLAIVGLLRRVVSTVQADPSSDPLLLVAPLVAGVLALLALRDGAHRRPSPLTYVVGLAFLVSVLGVAGPDYPLVDDVRGTLFWSVPLLWFVIARAEVDDALLRRILQLITILGLGACATGVVQATIGFPPWDERWIDQRGYIALGVDGPYTLRPFGWSASAGEFALTAAFTTILCGLHLREAVRARAGVAILLTAAGTALAASALVLTGVRTAVLLGLLAAVVVAAASRGAHAVRILGAVALATLLLVGGARLLDLEEWPTSGVQGLVRRSLLGLTDPFDPERSTLRIHIDITESALRTVDDSPLGGGTAYGTTDPEDREGAHQSAENDLGNAALAFGIPGVALVLALTLLGLRAAWARVRAGPTLVALGALGILVASLRFWWTGAQYASAMLVWLVLGWTDRPDRATPS